jgi:hypothetical protein
MNKLKKTTLSFFLLYALPISAQLTTENIYSSFLSENKQVTFKFFSRGNSDFEYICKKPSVSLDCRKDNIDYLKNKNNTDFIITKLINMDNNYLYEIYLDEEHYYLNAKRIINGINSTHYFSNDSLYRKDYFEQEEVYLKSIMNKSFIVNPEKVKKINLILCEDRIELNTCKTKKDKIEDIKKISVVDIYNKEKRHLVKLKLNEMDKEYWIDYYIFKILIQK